jgi:hypothetical protein
MCSIIWFCHVSRYSFLLHLFLRDRPMTFWIIPDTSHWISIIHVTLFYSHEVKLREGILNCYVLFVTCYKINNTCPSTQMFVTCCYKINKTCPSTKITEFVTSSLRVVNFVFILWIYYTSFLFVYKINIFRIILLSIWHIKKQNH